MVAKRNDYAYCVYYAKHEDEEFEIHARRVRTSDLLGFIEVEDFVFPKRNSVLIIPNGEKVEEEFKGVKRTYIPIRDIRRIDRYLATDTVARSNLKVLAMKPKSS